MEKGHPPNCRKLRTRDLNHMKSSLVSLTSLWSVFPSALIFHNALNLFIHTVPFFNCVPRVLQKFTEKSIWRKFGREGTRTYITHLISSPGITAASEERKSSLIKRIIGNSRHFQLFEIATEIVFLRFPPSFSVGKSLQFRFTVSPSTS